MVPHLQSAAVIHVHSSVLESVGHALSREGRSFDQHHLGLFRLSGDCPGHQAQQTQAHSLDVHSESSTQDHNLPYSLLFYSVTSPLRQSLIMGVAMTNLCETKPLVSHKPPPHTATLCGLSGKRSPAGDLVPRLFSKMLVSLTALLSRKQQRCSIY